MKSINMTVKAVLTSFVVGLAFLLAGSTQANTNVTNYDDSLSHLALAHHAAVDGWVTLNIIASQQAMSVEQVVVLMEEAAQEGEEVVSESGVKVDESQPVETVTQVSAPLVETPTPQAPAEAPSPEAPVSSVPYTSNLSPEELEAKEFIAQKESGGSYTARNGIFYGRYQLTESYLNGDLSPENQERVADAYVAERYGSWVAAKAFWLENHWY